MFSVAGVGNQPTFCTPKQVKRKPYKMQESPNKTGVCKVCRLRLKGWLFSLHFPFYAKVCTLFAPQLCTPKSLQMPVNIGGVEATGCKFAPQTLKINKKGFGKVLKQGGK